MKKLNIVIVDDEELLRNTLIELIETSFPTEIDGVNYQINCIALKDGLEFMKYTQKRIPNRCCNS